METRFDGGWNRVGFAEETQDVRHIFCRFSAITSANRSQSGSMMSDLINQADAALKNR